MKKYLQQCSFSQTILSADISLCCEMRVIACTLFVLGLLWDSVSAENSIRSLRLEAGKPSCYSTMIMLCVSAPFSPHCNLYWIEILAVSSCEISFKSYFDAEIDRYHYSPITLAQHTH